MDIPEGCELVMVPYVGDLLFSYLVDVGKSFHYVQRRDLRKADMTVEQLQTVALQNLSAKVSSEGVRVVPAGRYWAVLCGGNFEASLLVLDRIWDEIAELIGEEMLVALPARDLLAVAPLDDVEAAGALREFVERAWRNGCDHPLTQRLYSRIGGAWKPWTS